MNKIYHLSSCDTCRKIIKALPTHLDIVFRDVKTEPISETELEAMAKLSGSYESLFSKRAVLYKTYDLKNKDLKEGDFKKYLLEHYTFLSRPVFVIDNQIFVGNSKQNVLNARKALGLE
jgi:arsenate reductase (glutaredoxin)